MVMDPPDLIMDELVTVTNLYAVLGVTRTADSVYGPKRNVGFTMMLWQM